MSNERNEMIIINNSTHMRECVLHVFDVLLCYFIRYNTFYARYVFECRNIYREINLFLFTMVADARVTPAFG